MKVKQIFLLAFIAGQASSFTTTELKAEDCAVSNTKCQKSCSGVTLYGCHEFHSASAFTDCHRQTTSAAVKTVATCMAGCKEGVNACIAGSQK